MSANVVFCTTCKGRTQHLEITLPANLAENKTGKFVVLDYNSPDNLAYYLIANHGHDIDSGRLVVYSMPLTDNGHIPFKMAHAKNMAHRCGLLEGADILVNLDADNFAGMGFADYASQQMNDGAYLWAHMKKGQFRRGISGRIAVSRHAFLKAGGYDEKYETWGPDDKDFNGRLGRLGHSGKEIESQYLDALSHNDKMRFRDYKHVATDQEEGHFDLTDCVTTISNFGRVGCGTVYRNFDFSKPITLKPIPTRIFGIGLHKTATTSLHRALQALGYDSEHWPSAHWAKAIWSEMHSEGRSRTLEKHYAVCDLPIGVLFRQLDLAYPGSRFILTTRPDEEWLDSVRRHWDKDANPFRRAWDHDPFSHYLHKHIYGRRDFDAETMLARYKQHNAEVKDYFALRPEDLLVLSEHDWPELCRFLDQPIPESPYPRENGGH